MSNYTSLGTWDVMPDLCGIDGGSIAGRQAGKFALCVYKAASKGRGKAAMKVTSTLQWKCFIREQ